MNDEVVNELKNQIKEMILNKDKNIKVYSYDDSLKLKVKQALIDLDKNHNNSWAVEMYLKNCDNLESIAIKYRGNKITYKDMFEQSFEFAKSLKKIGYKKGSEIPVCISNIPEFVSMFLAISFIGAKMNVVGEWFDKKYLESILNSTKSDYIFVSDDVYEELKDVINSSKINKTIMFSLTDSFLEDKNGNKINPYVEIDNKFNKIKNKVKDFKLLNKNILDIQEFINIGKGYNDSVIADCSLDDDCAITYTSGTTDPGCPKGCLHPNRSYITLSRFKESDVSGMPSMRNLTVLAHIPTYTHMELTCAISDTFYEKCTLAMEPFYSKEFFPYSLLINKPNFVPAGAGFWIHLCKLLNYNEEWKKIKMPYLMIPTVTGEACSAGEEKFFNYTARKHKFGCDKLPFPLAPVTFSIGGGTSESSGIFVTLYKSLQEKKLNNLIHKETLGLTPHKFATIEVLDEDGDYCKIGQPGLLVANSPCNMKGYTNESLNKNIHVKDKYGIDWLSLGTYSFKSDKHGRIKMKGRLNSNIYLSDGSKVPFYAVEDIVSKDTKNIMSCTLVKILGVESDYYVCHIELQPESKENVDKVLRSCADRLRKNISQEILDCLYFKVRSFSESFPLAPSGKRNSAILIEEGINDNCISCNEVINCNSTKPKTKKIMKVR